MASGNKVGGSDNCPPEKKQMCLIKRRETTISPLNMTLAARITPQSKFQRYLNRVNYFDILINKNILKKKKKYLYYMDFYDYFIDLYN